MEGAVEDVELELVDAGARELNDCLLNGELEVAIYCLPDDEDDEADKGEAAGGEQEADGGGEGGERGWSRKPRKPWPNSTTGQPPAGLGPDGTKICTVVACSPRGRGVTAVPTGVMRAVAVSMKFGERKLA